MANSERHNHELKEGAAPRLLTEERRRAVLEIVDREGRVTVSDLTARFGVSAVTARADLDSLTESGRVVRSHGGAIRREETAFDEPLDVKGSQHHDEKVRIAQAAVELVRPQAGKPLEAAG